MLDCIAQFEINVYSSLDLPMSTHVRTPESTLAGVESKRNYHMPRLHTRGVNNARDYATSCQMPRDAPTKFSEAYEGGYRASLLIYGLQLK